MSAGGVIYDHSTAFMSAERRVYDHRQAFEHPPNRGHPSCSHLDSRQMPFTIIIGFRDGCGEH